MRFRKVDKVPLPAIPGPFPIKLYIVGIGSDGEEHVRYDLNLSLLRFGEQVHLENFTLSLENFTLSLDII